MVLDTSALVALLLDEPEAEEFWAAVEEDTTRLVSAGTLLETALIIESRKGEPGGGGHVAASIDGHAGRRWVGFNAGSACRSCA